MQSWMDLQHLLPQVVAQTDLQLSNSCGAGSEFKTFVGDSLVCGKEDLQGVTQFGGDGSGLLVNSFMSMTEIDFLVLW